MSRLTPKPWSKIPEIIKFMLIFLSIPNKLINHVEHILEEEQAGFTSQRSILNRDQLKAVGVKALGTPEGTLS